MRRLCVVVLLSVLVVGLTVPSAGAIVRTRGAACSLVGQPTEYGRVVFKAANYTGAYSHIRCYVKLRWTGGWVRFRSCGLDVPRYATRKFYCMWAGNWQTVSLYRVSIQPYDW